MFLCKRWTWVAANKHGSEEHGHGAHRSWLWIDLACLQCCVNTCFIVVCRWSGCSCDEDTWKPWFGMPQHHSRGGRLSLQAAPTVSSHHLHGQQQLDKLIQKQTKCWSTSWQSWFPLHFCLCHQRWTEVMFSPLFVCLCAGYLKKLWMDSDETWWTVWVCDHNKLFDFGEDPNPDLDTRIT